MRALRAAKENAVDALIEANQEFHLQLARMTHNRELEPLVRGLLERSTRLVYLAARGARQAATRHRNAAEADSGCN
jgi:DNA-binding GntR family transcriptional regulator